MLNYKNTYEDDSSVTFSKLRNPMIEAVAEAARKKVNILKWNNNNTDKNDEFNLKRNSFGDENQMVEAVIEASRNKVNIQKTEY